MNFGVCDQKTNPKKILDDHIPVWVKFGTNYWMSWPESVVEGVLLWSITKWASHVSKTKLFALKPSWERNLALNRFQLINPLINNEMPRHVLAGFTMCRITISKPSQKWCVYYIYTHTMFIHFWDGLKRYIIIFWNARGSKSMRRPWSTGGWFRMKQTTSDNLTVYFQNIIKILIYIEIYIYTCQKLSRQETPHRVGGVKRSCII